MKRMLFVAIVGIVMTTGLCALCIDSPPSHSTLWTTMARLNEKGQVVLTSRIIRKVTVTRVLRDGKEVEEQHAFYEAVGGWEDRPYDPKDIKLLGSDGTPLDKKMLPELLKNERPVVYMYGEGAIQSTFFRIIKEGTPILVLPYPPQFSGPS